VHDGGDDLFSVDPRALASQAEACLGELDGFGGQRFLTND
jgi:hypothetical protein